MRWLLLVLLFFVQPAKAEPAHASRQMVASAHPLASQAGLDVLRDGGSAVDAAITVALVLSVVEPQASGLGGGALMLAWDGAASALHYYEGLSSAPAGVGSTLLAPDEVGKPTAFTIARSGRAAGVPGEVALLALAHAKHGKLPWARLVEPAARIAEQGFAMPHELHTVLSRSPEPFAAIPALRALYFDNDGAPLATGTMLHNPEQARALKLIAEQGPSALYAGPVGEAIVDAAKGSAYPGSITAADLAAYKAQERPPLCATAFAHRLCTAGPPASGGVAVLQQLGLLERHDYARLGFGSPEATHLLLEASRLATADRRRWVADPDQRDVPTEGLVNPGYLDTRSALITEAKAMERAPAGDPPRRHGALPPESEQLIVAGTSHVAIVDAAGNAVAMTVTNNLNFGARVVPMGFTLNNGLSNFALNPDAQNSMAPGRRPATTMAPTIVFGADGRPEIVAGAGGGAWIVDAVAVGLAEMLTHGADPQAAVALPRIGAQNGESVIEKDTPPAAQAEALRAQGHKLRLMAIDTGMQALKITKEGLQGGADPRRDGVALGD
jgi:gamma-glutamyltranspeptidase/glutathione hydrolase